MNLNSIYILNPEYTLRADKNRIILLSTTGSNHSYSIFIHPVWALILSHFDGCKSFKEILQTLSNITGLSESNLLSQLQPLIENVEKRCIRYDGDTFWFPEQVLIKSNGQNIRTDLNQASFMIEPPYDFKTRRLNYPHSIMLVMNMHCSTDCIYCYADKCTPHKQMGLEKILSLIDEAHTNGVVNFDLSGGEIFKTKGWEVILKKLYSLHYDPYLSTKVPLTLEEIDRLYDTGARKIQISLDSLDSQLVQETLKVAAGYRDKIKDTILNLNEKGFDITIKSVLTRTTCTTKNLRELVEFMKTVPYVRQYTYTPVGYSHYKSVEAFNGFKPTLEQIKEMKDFFTKVQQEGLPFTLRPDTGTVATESEWRNEGIFRKRAVCSGNVYTMIILPDGQATICEELYWNPNFLIGDVTQNSIAEVWQSEKAVSLWKLKKERFPIGSPCRTCEEFEDCRYYEGVCWKEIIANYGKENWLYPDVHCPKAPLPIQPVYYDNSFITQKKITFQP